MIGRPVITWGWVGGGGWGLGVGVRDWSGGGGSVWGLGVGARPLNDRINLFFSILVTFIFLNIDTVCLDAILIYYADSKNIMFYTELFFFSYT